MVIAMLERFFERLPIRIRKKANRFCDSYLKPARWVSGILILCLLADGYQAGYELTSPALEFWRAQNIEKLARDSLFAAVILGITVVTHLYYRSEAAQKARSSKG